MIVVDASVLANAVADDHDDGDLARQALWRGGDLAAPDLVDVETVAVLRKRWIAETLTERRFAAAIGDLIELEIERYPTGPFMARAYELRSNVTPYDAASIALAETLRCTLVTGDGRLARAPGIHCEVRLLG